MDNEHIAGSQGYLSLCDMIGEFSKREGAKVNICGHQIHKEKSYNLLRVSAGTENERIVMISAGFHGNERAGPITLRDSIRELIDYARSKNIGLIVYPCVNPAGFIYKSRYTPDDERPNNDFVRYFVNPGLWVDDLGAAPRTKAISWGWATMRDMHVGLPSESRALRKDLRFLGKKGLLKKVCAVIDIHQDPYIEEKGWYAYVYGNRERYERICGEVNQILPCIALRQIKSGYPDTRDLPEEVDPALHDHPSTDANGLITRYDCGLTDLFNNLKVPHCITIETTTQTETKTATQVNLVWISGIMDLVAQ